MNMVIEMRIPNISSYTTGSYQYGGNRSAEIMQKPVVDGMTKRNEPDAAETSNVGRNGNVTYTPDGDILDFDWNRIRRFVQRFAWNTEPPESIKDFRQYRENRAPSLSWDGDRVDFNFERPENSTKTYGSEGVGKADIAEPKGACHTCESRRYVDESDDSSVSYQTPTKLSPSTAALAVGAHEREHVYNERADAQRNGREIVNQTVSIKYAVCPECHKMYAAGGVTRTQSVSRHEDTQTPTDEEPTPPQKET